jgi:hypothetical protein
MVRFPLARLLLPLAGLLLAPPALAQTPAPPPAKPAQVKGAPAKNAQGKRAAPAKAPQGRPKKAAVAARRKDRAEPGPAASIPIHGPIVSAPGFRLIEDGKSRVFLEVSEKVEITERKAQGRIVYQLKGAHTALRNSRLPLPTGVFPTPVGRVELADQGDGADLVIELREPATPVYQVIDTPRGIALQVDFPPPAVDRATAPSTSPVRASKQLAPSEGPSE